MKRLIFFLVFVCFTAITAYNQAISGTISDYFSKKPLDAVTIQTTSGRHAISDSLGRYVISVNRNDSIWFSYLNKQTMKYVVDTITHPQNFDIALYVDARWLPEVRVQTKDYKLDSIENRQTYAKAFNYRKPGLRFSQNPTTSSYVPGSVTAALDLDEIINAFRFKRNRQLAAFQQRLIQDEQDKYIDHRYTKYLGKKLTGLNGKELDDFMNFYRPSYEQVLMMNDLELGYYIEQCYSNYIYLRTHKLPKDSTLNR
ncbi:MAG TPA: hypothetical protein VFW07_02655 [Parafilimonas sp.]|nr:hypothetical protein [Parafilimonas sp.]